MKLRRSRTLLRLLGLGCGLLAFVTPACEPLMWAQEAQTASDELIQIDGRKNPELVPQWNAWGFAFRVFSGGPRELPTSVLTHVTTKEQALIMREADAVQKISAECRARHQKLFSEGTKTLNDLAREVWDLTLECRWATLHARDRVLATVSPDAQVALNAFVESTKAGTTISIPKKDLARFREPE
jgi:hypothetical protein